MRHERARKLRVLGYFLSLGLGFILVEIGFMQTFVLFLGHPIYALAVVLASLLAPRAFGSALSGRGVARYGLAGQVRRAVLALAVVLLDLRLRIDPLVPRPAGPAPRASHRAFRWCWWSSRGC